MNVITLFFCTTSILSLISFLSPLYQLRKKSPPPEGSGEVKIMKLGKRQSLVSQSGYNSTKITVSSFIETYVICLILGAKF